MEWAAIGVRNSFPAKVGAKMQATPNPALKNPRLLTSPAVSGVSGAVESEDFEMRGEDGEFVGLAAIDWSVIVGDA